MAHIEATAWGDCHECGKPVAVKKNRSGLAYYRCDHCGVEHKHHSQRSSDRYLQQFAAPASAKEGDGGAANRGEQPAPAAKKSGGGLGAFFS